MSRAHADLHKPGHCCYPTIDEGVLCVCVCAWVCVWSGDIMWSICCSLSTETFCSFPEAVPKGMELFTIVLPSSWLNCAMIVLISFCFKPRECSPNFSFLKSMLVLLWSSGDEIQWLHVAQLPGLQCMSLHALAPLNFFLLLETTFFI